MGSWLMLRGSWDERTQKSIETKDDLWLSLFEEMVNINKGVGAIYFKDKKYYETPFEFDYYKSIDIWRGAELGNDSAGDWDYIFSRGSFQWQADILRKFPNAYKIKYSAGRRIFPEPDINYSLILCDSDNQKQQILQRYPKARVELFIKPAAWHFKPIECKKEYDICFIAKHQQAHFKGTKWVYETVPRDLKVLHLGGDGSLNPPPNVTCKQVGRIDIPAEISRCKVGIVPYWNQIDSCPRIIPEMLACGLPLIIADELNFWEEKYRYGYYEGSGLGWFINLTVSSKETFWQLACYELAKQKYRTGVDENMTDYYQKNLSIPIAAKYIKGLING